MQNIHQILNLYLKVLNTHLNNNNSLCECYIVAPNAQLSENTINLWINRHIEINNQFGDQLFQVTLDFHAEALRYFDQHLMPNIDEHLK